MSLPTRKWRVRPSVRSSVSVTSASSARTQRTRLPLTEWSGTSAAVQRGSALGQRGAKRQPCGGFARFGGEPGMPSSRTLGPRSEGNAASSPCEYGWSGRSNSSLVFASSATWPAYITSSRSEKWLTSDMSCVTKITANPSSSCSSLICTISERWATTSSAEVGSSMMISSGVKSSAIAIIARCRIPPESWCG